MRELTRVQSSLLLYLECRATDHAGRIRDENMNAEDFAQAKAWNDEGFIKFGRVASNFIRDGGGAHWVKLSDEAWAVAHAARRARGERMWEGRAWLTAAEKRSA